MLNILAICLFKMLIFYPTINISLAQSRGNPSLSRDAGLTQLLDIQRDTLRSVGFIPLIIAGNEKVGDILDVSTLGTLASSERCFPRLQFRRGPSALPTIRGNSARGLAAALGVPNAAEIGMNANQRFDFEISYHDVEVISTTIEDLRTALPRISRSTRLCNRIEDLQFLYPVTQTIYENFTDRMEALPYIISKVYIARRTITIRSSDTLDAGLSLQGIAARIRALRATIGASASNTSSSEIINISQAPVGISVIRTVGYRDNPQSRPNNNSRPPIPRPPRANYRPESEYIGTILQPSVIDTPEIYSQIELMLSELFR